MIIPGTLLWVLGIVGFCFLLIAIGLLAAVINTSHLESEQERQHQEHQAAMWARAHRMAELRRDEERREWKGDTTG